MRIVLLWLGMLVASFVFLMTVVSVWTIGTFETWLTCITSLCGVFWFAELIFFKTKSSNIAAENSDKVAVDQLKEAQPKKAQSKEEVQANIVRRSITFLGSLFPVLFFVFALRSFIVEPFRIPSGSMLPTLLIGDFVLVNKFDYGIRLPIGGNRVLGSGRPERGDVVVFRYPNQPDIDYIKRVIGLPGDVLTLKGNRIYINGQIIPVEFRGLYKGKQQDFVGGKVNLSLEKLGSKKYSVLNLTHGSSNLPVTIPIPENRYFVMGDNRDHSSDSRYWGFVSDKHLKGRALFVWMNWGDEFDVSRIGTGL